MESFESITCCVSDAICERDHDSNSQVLVEIVCLVQFWWSVFMTPCLNYNAVAVLAIEGLQFGGSLLVYWVYWYSYNTFLLSLALREINTLSYRVYLCQALLGEIGRQNCIVSNSGVHKDTLKGRVRDLTTKADEGESNVTAPRFSRSIFFAWICLLNFISSVRKCVSPNSYK